jgi:hypothetical protein
MVITKRKKKENYPLLTMNDVPLEEVKSHKNLGVTLSKTLLCDEHIENIATKANQCLDVLNALKYKLDRKSLEKMYFAFIRSKLEYANIVLDNCPSHLSDFNTRKCSISCSKNCQWCNASN